MQILESPYGFKSDRFHPPYRHKEAKARLESLEHLIKALRKQGGDPTAVVAAQREIGVALYRALFAGEVGKIYVRSNGLIDARACDGLRLRIAFDPNHSSVGYLAALPWELLYDPDEAEHVGRGSRTLIWRYLETGRYIRPFAVAGQLRVLVADSTPEGLQPLKLAEEIKQIRKRLEDSPDIEVARHSQPMLHSLRQRLVEEPFHVLHFMGHGGFDPESGEGCLAFCHADGSDQYVSGEMLAEYLKDLEPLRLVVLSSCASGKLPQAPVLSPMSGVAAALVKAGVPAVVAMQFSISDAASIDFSDAFYAALAQRESVDLAVARGRLAIFGNATVGSEWATPALFSRVKDAQIFARSTNAAALPAAPASKGNAWATAPTNDHCLRTTPRPIRVGIRSGVHLGGSNWSHEMEAGSDLFLDLDDYFDGRVIRDHTLWQKAIFPRLEEILFRAAAERREIHLDFAAHQSIAFGAGYCLEAKSGLDIRIRQRQQGGIGDWWSQDSAPPDGSLWNFESNRASALNTDIEQSNVALVISLTTPILTDVEAYLLNSALPVERVLPASLFPEPSPTGVKSGAHALHLAQQLANQLRTRTTAERRGVLHIFAAGPNAFLFFLGQLARGFGRVCFYESAGSYEGFGNYYPTIQLPPRRDT